MTPSVLALSVGVVTALVAIASWLEVRGRRALPFQPLEGTVASRVAEEISGEAPSICFHVPAVSFRFEHEAHDSFAPSARAPRGAHGRGLRPDARSRGAMLRLLPLTVALALLACGARTGLEAPDGALVCEAGLDPIVTERDGRPIPCGDRACDPTHELCFACGGGGGCSTPSHCVSLDGCTPGCACDCARARVRCAYPTYCSVRNTVVTVSCPPD
jgi:hypothetical protein